MKNCYVFLCCLLLQSAWAQHPELQSPDLSPTDFTCANPPGCIANPTLDDVGPPSTDGWLSLKSTWYTSHGSPTPGASSVWLWSYGGGGEGMYTCFNFESGKQYKVCMTIRTDNPPGSLGYENPDAIFNVQATNGDFFPLLDNPLNQVIAAWHAIDQVETAYTFTFTANSNYNKLWLFPYMLVHAPTPVDQYSMNTFDVKVEEVHTPTLAVSGNTITIANSPTGGHWDWTPASAVTASNPDGTLVSITAPCNDIAMTATFVSDCALCTSPILHTNLEEVRPPTMVLGSSSVCEGGTIQLSVASVISAVRTYQWMQLDGTPIALNNNSTFSGVTTPILTINTTTGLNGAQFYCVITTLPDNCISNSEAVSIAVFPNPPLPVVTVTHPSGGNANGSILVTAPIADTIQYRIDDEQPQFLPLFENLPAGAYEVSAVSGSGCESNLLVTLAEPVIGMIPKGISPNDDGNNDAFDLTGIGNIRQVKIFNRYGVNVYSKAHYLNEWKGQTDKGKSLPTAAYYYVIFFENGEAKTGWVYLQREI